MMRKIKKLNTKEILTKKDLIDAIKLYKKKAGQEGALIFFDTETTGLNIKYDLPFVLPWGFMIDDEAFIYCVDKDKDPHLFQQTALTIVKLAKDKGLCGHNIKYDLHMLNNINIETPDDILYRDTMILIRLAHDALTVANGGPPLGLKEYATKYIDRSAKDHEHLLKEERKNIAKEYNTILKNRLYKIDRKWTISYLNDYFKDVLHSVDTLDERARAVYL